MTIIFGRRIIWYNNNTRSFFGCKVYHPTSLFHLKVDHCASRWNVRFQGQRQQLLRSADARDWECHGQKNGRERQGAIVSLLLKLCFFSTWKQGFLEVHALQPVLLHARHVDFNDFLYSLLACRRCRRNHPDALEHGHRSWPKNTSNASSASGMCINERKSWGPSKKTHRGRWSLEGSRINVFFFFSGGMILVEWLNDWFLKFWRLWNRFNTRCLSQECLFFKV